MFDPNDPIDPIEADDDGDGPASPTDGADDSAANSNPDSVDGIVGPEWVLVTIGGDAVATLRQPSVLFGPDGRFAGSSGVNRMFGGYRIDEGQLTIDGPGTTLMAGPPDAMAIEAAFVRALTGGGEIVGDGDRLRIGTGDRELVFRAVVESTVHVTVAYREHIAMPAGASVVVTLADVSHADATADVIATARVDEAGNVPVTVELTYDAGRIDERHTYDVRATIEVGGEMWWTSTDAHHVLTNGATNRVDVLVTRVTR
jgi:uncharacterized lipoprotein YbaY/heat shock protein HslJ